MPAHSRENSYPPIRLERASLFSIEQLTAFYNQARADYLVPMQTTADQLAQYIDQYDVKLEKSWVALEGNNFAGLIMLGIRAKRGWVTRLGVDPQYRLRGVGGALLNALFQDAQENNLMEVFLEVIAGNDPAQALFEKFGFSPTRKLLVLRREAGPICREPTGRITWLDHDDALGMLGNFPGNFPWTNQLETFRHQADARAIQLDFSDGQKGCLVFRYHNGKLSHLVLQTEAGDPEQVGYSLVSHLYRRYSNAETSMENIVENDPHLGALVQAGFEEIFQRVEMRFTVRKTLK